MNERNIKINIWGLPTPCYIIDERLLLKNLKVLKYVQNMTGCKILLAQKAFSMYSTYPLIKQYIAGSTASGLYEARLGREEMGGEVHIFNPAYREADFGKIVQLCDHIVFNNFAQLERFYPAVKASDRDIEVGIRINPEYSELEKDIYNPCAPFSRLGCTIDKFPERLPEYVSGLHFHTMCEQGADVLDRTVKKAEERFGKYFHGLKWINFGGGHHITRENYDVELLISVIKRVKDAYKVQVYLEPGEAVALNAGYLVTEVLDVFENGMGIAITDASAACHMPDVLEMPYRPHIYGSGEAGEKRYTYRLGGPTCLAGDIIGDYSFDKPLKAGDRLIFKDMAIYSMVKNNTFNGIPLPAIILHTLSGEDKIIRSFSYEDFKSRL